MKKILLLFCLIEGITNAQEFRTLQLVPDSDFVITQTGKRVSYVFNIHTFETFGKQLKVRCNKKLILTDEGTDNITGILPHLFISLDTNNVMVLMTDISSDVLTGFNLYLLKSLEPNKIGFFPVAAKLPGSESEEEFLKSASAANNILIEVCGNEMRVSFTTGLIILRPGTDREEVVDGSTVKFLYNGKKLKEVDEF